jgi:TonB-dependent receptor
VDASDAALKGGGSGAAITAMSAVSGATAAASDDGGAGSEVKEVVVTGIRGSLQKSMNVKKNADGIVDAISAEDIGKFPDSNLAQAMERIPGITVTHGNTAIGGTQTSTGDATQITVRGFGPGFNETLYDGRQISTATGSANRGFDFSAVGADFVSQIDVMKTPDATVSSGAIGATVNVQFGKPFDHPGLRVSGSVSASVNDHDGTPTPNGSFLFSDTFFGDTVGVLFDASYSDLRDQANHINNQGWIGTYLDPTQYAGGVQTPSTGPWIYSSPTVAAQYPNGPNWFSQDYGIYQEQSNEERVNGRAVLQWRPAANLLFTLNDNYSRDRLQDHEYGVTWWFNAGLASANHISNVVTNAHGTVVDFQTAGGTTSNGEPTDFQSQIVGSDIVNNEAGFNAKWNVTNNLKLDLDLDHSESWLNPTGDLDNIDADVGYGDNLNNTQLGETGLNGSAIPYPNGYGPYGIKADFLGNGAGGGPGGIIGSHVVPLGTQQNYDSIEQVKFQAIWTQEHLRLRFGVQYLDENERLTGSGDIFATDADNDWQAYSGYGPASGNGTGVALNPAWFTGSFSTANFINGYSGANNLPPQVLKFNALQVIDYLQSLGNPQTTTPPGNIPGFNCGSAWENAACVPGHFNGTFRAATNSGSVQNVRETTASIFLDGAYDTMVGDFPLKVLAGARVDRTNVLSAGIASVDAGLFTPSPGDPTAYGVTATNPQPVSAKNNYTYLLPNLDIKLYLRPNLVARFDASRTETKQALNLLVPDLNFSTPRIGNLPATGGNPHLLPDLSDNIDLGVEWYYTKNSYVSVDYFVKQIRNFLKGGTYNTTFPGVYLPDPWNHIVGPGSNQGDPGVAANGLAEYIVSSNTNEGSYKVQGVEIADQYVFGDSGFGYVVNLTFVKSDHPYNPYDLTGSNLAVTGLADSWNLIGFYDKHGFQARMAVNWRDNVLDRFGQTQNSTIWGTEPTFVKAAYYVDFSTSYQFTPRLTAYFEALNLTDQVYSTYGRFSEQVLDLVDTGRRFNLGVRLKY